MGILSEMRQRHLEPDVVSYNATISACEKGDKWGEILGQVGASWVAPNVVSYSAAISACDKGEKWCLVYFP